MYGLKETHIQAISAILNQFAPLQKAIIYGSRAKGTYRPASDIDLCLVGADLSFTQLNQLSNDLDDLLLPIHIDLALQHQIDNPDLLAHIERVGKIFWQRELVAS